LIGLFKTRSHRLRHPGSAERHGARDPIERALEAAAARYVGLHPRFLWYARLKYRMDPCYRAIASHIGEGSFTVDLGTGLGMLPVLLGELGERRRALGVDELAAPIHPGNVLLVARLEAAAGHPRASVPRNGPSRPATPAGGSAAAS
jgi:hypothetical protein